VNTTRHCLTGLDGQNPLGYFAALGLLRVLDAQPRSESAPPPRLWFESDGRELAHVESPLSIDAIVEAVVADARDDSCHAALGLTYDDKGLLVPPEAEGAIRDLKPSPEAARTFLDAMTRLDRPTADLAASLFSELVQDNNGNTKPTAFHFAAGQQRWLDMTRALRRGVHADHVRAALLGPWEEVIELPSMAWDSSVARNYALRATNPSTEKRGTVPGAHWLAVLGLSFFPVIVRRGRLVTTRVEGGWKDSVFTWPIWSAPASVPVVTSLLRTDVRRLNAAERAAMGVTRCFESAILRSDQGGYGSFTPAAPRSPQVQAD
jgi:hypothetical protein